MKDGGDYNIFDNDSICSDKNYSIWSIQCSQNGCDERSKCVFSCALRSRSAVYHDVRQQGDRLDCKFQFSGLSLSPCPEGRVARQRRDGLGFTGAMLRFRIHIEPQINLRSKRIQMA